MAHGAIPRIAFAAIGSPAINEIVCPDERFARLLARI
jgi:hypothetical protein